MTPQELMDQLERSGVPKKEFWENDLEMAVEPVLRSATEDGFLMDWLGKRQGRQISMLCRALEIDEDGSGQKKKSLLRELGRKSMPYLLVEQFAKYKSKVAVIEMAKGCLSNDVLQICQRDDNGDDYDTTALLFALYGKDPENLRLVFHLDKIHKTGFARMKLKTNPRRPSRSLKETLQSASLIKILEDFDRKKRDGRRSELKDVISHGGRFMVFIRRANRPDLILGNAGVLHGFKPEWIILDFEEDAKRLNISSDSVSVPLEIANRVVSDYYGMTCEYDNESEITYAKQIEKFLKKLIEKENGDALLVELVVRNSPLNGSPKIKIIDSDSNPIGQSIVHFEKAIGNLLGDIENLESVKVYFKKKRVSLIFEPVEDKNGEYVVRYSDHRLNAGERVIFEDYIRKEYGIPILSTEKRFKR